MKILVCIKQVPDTETKIRLKSDNSAIDDNGVKWVMNPYDEFAVEEALQLKQANSGASVTVMSLGPSKRVMNTLRTGLAMGADDGVLIDGPGDLDFFTTSKALAKAAEQEGPYDVIFTGKLAIDDNNSSVSQALAEFLKVPHTTVVSKFSAEGDSYIVEREVEGGAREVVQLQKPAVVGANKGLNTPRYVKLPEIMKAKKKPVKELGLGDLGVDASQQKIQLKNFQMPAEKPPVKMLDGDAGAQAQELAKLLREEAKII